MELNLLFKEINNQGSDDLGTRSYPAKLIVYVFAVEQGIVISC
jgi:hypothetical protein